MRSGTNGRGRSTPRPPRRSVVVLLALYLVAVTVVTVAALVGDVVIDDVAGPFYMLFSCIAAVWSVRTARHPRLDSRTRRGWWIIAFSLLIMSTANVLFAIASEEIDASEYPIVADWVRLAWAPVMLAGVLAMPNRTRGAENRTKMALDLGMVLVAGAMLMWHLVIGPVVFDQGQRVAVTVVALAYPLLDLALIGAATIVVFRTASPSSRRPLLLLSASVTAMVTGDMYLGYLRVRSETTNHGWQFLAWTGACLLIALAAADQHRLAEDHRIDSGPDRVLRPMPRLPYAAIMLGYTLLVVVSIELPLYPYGGLIIGAVIMTGFVVGRQITALRENYHLVVTDNLTGLANRALLRDRLTRAVQRADRTGDPVAVLQIDLNRFKEINDSLGHEAGDEMLVAVSRLLERCVRRHDTVARLGGDEFAVVFEGADAAAVASDAMARIETAMTVPVTVAGRPMLPSASIGMAVSEPDGDSVNALLHRADTAMYRAKRVRTDVRPPPSVTPSTLVDHWH